MISVVIPTVSGREALLEQTKNAFRDTADVEFVVVRNQPTCGEAWNIGAEAASGDHLMLAGDDFLPAPGWAEVAIDAAEDGVYPAPWIKHPDGSTECCGSLGQGLYLLTPRDGALAYNAQIPFMKREAWDLIGPSIPAHYYADDYLAYKARAFAGLEVETREGYAFLHLDGQSGKARNKAKGEAYRQMFAEAVNEL